RRSSDRTAGRGRLFCSFRNRCLRCRGGWFCQRQGLNDLVFGSLWIVARRKQCGWLGWYFRQGHQNLDFGKMKKYSCKWMPMRQQRVRRGKRANQKAKKPFGKALGLIRKRLSVRKNMLNSMVSVT